MAAVDAGNGARPRYENAIHSALGTLGIEIVDLCTCSPTEQMYCAADDCKGGSELYVWVERTWWDVRLHDVVRPPGQDERAATVVRLPNGLVNHWHADHTSNPRWPTPMEHSSIPVTLQPLGQGEESAFTPPQGASPDLPVEIRVTRGELAAIEALGGWKERVAINESGA